MDPAPTAFWVRRGGQGRSPGGNTPAAALILRGDWCAHRFRHRQNETRDAKVELKPEVR